MAHTISTPQSESALHAAGRHTSVAAAVHGVQFLSTHAMSGHAPGSLSQLKPLGQLTSPQASSANAVTLISSGKDTPSASNSGNGCRERATMDADMIFLLRNKR